MAVLAPIPSASVSTAIRVKAGSCANLRKAKRRSANRSEAISLVPKSDHWVNLAGAVSRPPASDESDKCEDDSHAGNSGQIRGANAVKQTAQDATHPEHATDSQDDTETDE